MNRNMMNHKIQNVRLEEKSDDFGEVKKINLLMIFSVSDKLHH